MSTGRAACKNPAPRGVEMMVSGFALRAVWLVAITAAAVGCASGTGRSEAIGAETAAAWERQDVEALIGAVERAGADGLNPADYGLADLQAAFLSEDSDAVKMLAPQVFNSLAADLADGAVPPEARRRWFIDGPRIDPPAIDLAMTNALRAHRVGEALAGFAPIDPRYQALKKALAETPLEDAQKRYQLRLNMERWRWMPRDLGPNYVLINVAAFELIVVKSGAEIDRRRIIAGAVKTPTPQFAAQATGLVINPVWYVPSSIVAESVGALIKRDPEKAKSQGFYIASDGGVRQKPGPLNSLGVMKLAMPNRHSVFVHDTPAKALFKRDVRALSHGCIRVEGALDFAKLLLAPAWDERALAAVAVTGSTVEIEFESPIPVYVAYFTAAPNASGEISFFPDIYGLDALVYAGKKDELAAHAAGPVNQGECSAPRAG